MKKVLHIITLLAALLVATPAWAQYHALKVTSFQETTDDDATNPLTLHAYTQNGQERLCAIIKVKAPVDGLQFDGRTESAPEHKGTGEYWVYMYGQSLRLKVLHQGSYPVTVDFADYGVKQLQNGKCYSHQLTQVEQAVDPFVQKNAFTMGLGYYIRPYGGPSFSLGYTYNRISFEVTGSIGINSVSDMSIVPVAEYDNTYYVSCWTPVQLQAHLGYDFILGRRVALTPQVGLALPQSLQTVGQKAFVPKWDRAAPGDYAVESLPASIHEGNCEAMGISRSSVAAYHAARTYQPEVAQQVPQQTAQQVPLQTAQQTGTTAASDVDTGLPTDGQGAIIETAYSLKDFYQQLGAMPAAGVTVFMDACFSGAQRGNGMLAAARSVAIKPKKDAPQGRVVVFSAAQGDETAYPFREKGHGLFTYFLLKKLKETGGQVSLGELGDYVTDQVARKSIVTNGKSQTPSISTSTAMGADWKQLKLR